MINNSTNPVINHNDCEIVTLDNLGFGEKRVLKTLYSLGKDELKAYTLYRSKDIWQAYYTANGEGILAYVAPSLFDLCFQLVLSLRDEDLINQFTNVMNSSTNEDLNNNKGPKLS